MDGIFNVNKPAGITSFRVVAVIRRWSGEKKVGHAGTLDPDATGVLPVCLGKATRIVSYMTSASKTYAAVVELGAETDTYDAGGNVVRREDSSAITREKVESALNSFRGSIHQTPPMYSALKHRGQPLYKLARAGVNIERKSRPVTIHRLEITDFQPPLVTLEIECSKGTYIRSLAHDLGQALGCGAMLKTLTRTRCGVFDLKDAVTLPQIEETFGRGDVDKLLYPPDHALQGMPAVTVNENGTAAIKTGKAMEPGWVVAGHADKINPRYRVYSGLGVFLGIVKYEAEIDAWRPEKVFG